MGYLSYDESVSANRWDMSINFKRIDMKVKIDNLKDDIPDFIYNNKIM